MRSKIIPANILKRMSKGDRKSVCQMTGEEAVIKYLDGQERALHADIIRYLDFVLVSKTGHRGYFRHDSMHKRTSCRKGAPDFEFPYRGTSVHWECKVGRNTLTPEQEEIREQIIRQGGQYRVIHSLHEAQQHLREIDSKATNERK